MADLTLYTNPMSRGRIARWMLEEVGVPYRTEVLIFGETMKDEAFLAINPMGKVPTLTHGDQVITEAAAVCAYLADAFPDAGLAPQPEERGAYYRWMFFAAGPVEAAITNHALGLDPPAERAQMVGYGNFDATMDALERAVSTSPYIAGERFTAADVYVAAGLMYGLQFGTIPARAAFEAYAGRVNTRPAFARANALDDADAAALQQAG